MTSLSDYKFYNLQEEIDKYTKFEDNLDNISIDNENNKHKVRDDFIDILIKKLKLPELYTKDLEIGVFNATIDYANNYGIQLSWKNQMLVETYVNISRVFILILKKTVMLAIKICINAWLKRRSLHHICYHICNIKTFFLKDGKILLKRIKEDLKQRMKLNWLLCPI